MAGDNFTNRELVHKAMPLVSLSRKDWHTLLKHIEEVQRGQGEDCEVFKVLETLYTNQARIEVMGNYTDYYSDILDEPVSDRNVCGLQIA